MTPYGVEKFMDFYFENDPEKRDINAAAFQAVNGMLEQDNLKDTQIDLREFLKLTSLADTLRWNVAPDGTSPASEVWSQRLTDAKIGLTQLIGNTDALGFKDRIDFLSDYVGDPVLTKEKVSTLNSYLGDNLASEVLKDYDAYRNIAPTLKVSDSNAKALIGEDPQNFMDAVKGLRNYFEWGSISILMDSAEGFYLEE